MKKRTVSTLVYVVVSLVAVLLIACARTLNENDRSPSDQDVFQETLEPRARHDVRPASCDPPLPADSGVFYLSMSSGGVPRDYILHIPPQYDGVSAVPALLNLHGVGGSARQQVTASGLGGKAFAEGFILITPEGTGSPSGWNFLLDRETNDVEFIADILDVVSDAYCIDPQRVYSAGFSQGAQMSIRLVCDIPDRIAAVGAVAGLFYPPLSPQDIADEPDCSSDKPAPIIAFHGTQDTVIPFEGGMSRYSVRLRSIEDAILPTWAEHNGCVGGPNEREVAATVRLILYEDCDAGTSVALYIFDGGGHEWLETEEVNTTDLLWEFLSAHSLRR